MTLVDRLTRGVLPAPLARPLLRLTTYEAVRRREGRIRAEQFLSLGVMPTLAGVRAPDAVTPRVVPLAAPSDHREPARALMQFWDRDMPADVAALTAETRAVCADLGLEHVLLDDAAGRAALAEIEPAVVPHYDRAFHPAMKADILRLHWLYAHGGYYCDADLTVTRALPTTMPAPTVLFAAKRVSNAFMFTAPRRPLFAHLTQRLAENLEGYFRAKRNGAHDPLDLIAVTGPMFMKYPVNEYFAARQDASVRFATKHDRRAFVVLGQKFLGRPLDYKDDARNWHHGMKDTLDARRRERLGDDGD